MQMRTALVRAHNHVNVVRRAEFEHAIGAEDDRHATRLVLLRDYRERQSSTGDGDRRAKITQGGTRYQK